MAHQDHMMGEVGEPVCLVAAAAAAIPTPVQMEDPAKDRVAARVAGKIDNGSVVAE